MMHLPRLFTFLLLGAHAIEEGADTASRELRGKSGKGDHGEGHDGGERNHTHGNMTNWLNQTCTENNIVCSDVAAEVLANCTNFTEYGRWHQEENGSSGDGRSADRSSGDESTEDESSEDESSEDNEFDRALLVINEAEGMKSGDAELQELYNMFVGAIELKEKMDVIPSSELRGSITSFGNRDLGKKRRHEDGGRHGGDGYKYGKWGNLTDAEIEEMKLRRLTCQCCKDYSG